jgi:hypothetical protein
VPHEVLVGIPENVVVLGPVLREIEFRLGKDTDEIAETVDPVLPIAEFVRIIESGKSLRARRGLASMSGWMTSVLIRFPMSASPMSATMSRKLAPFGIVIGGSNPS